jgi:hypothetical protein
VRRYAQAQVYRHLHATGSGPYDTPIIETALSKVATQLNQVARETTS